MKHLIFVLSAAAGAAFGADPASFHGMALFGQTHTYISHLPMFHRPHDYQAVAEVNLGAANSVYVADVTAHPEESLYTLAPEKNFVLPQVFRAQGVFPATLYRGHFERGGTPIAEDVAVQIRTVFYFQKFTPGAASPPQAAYFAVGIPGELFLLHQIVAAPDFDQIVLATGKASSGNLIAPSKRPLAVGGKIDGLSVTKVLYTEFDDLK